MARPDPFAGFEQQTHTTIQRAKIWNGSSAKTAVCIARIPGCLKAQRSLSPHSSQKILLQYNKELKLHWGFIGETRKGFGPNSLTPFVGDQKERDSSCQDQ